MSSIPACFSAFPRFEENLCWLGMSLELFVIGESTMSIGSLASFWIAFAVVLAFWDKLAFLCTPALEVGDRQLLAAADESRVAYAVVVLWARLVRRNRPSAHASGKP